MDSRRDQVGKKMRRSFEVIKTKEKRVKPLETQNLMTTARKNVVNLLILAERVVKTPDLLRTRRRVA